MAAGHIYRKTALGAEEIAQRKMKLNPRLRTMLILVDGTRPEFLVKEEGERLGAPPDFLDQLLRLRLIERTGTVAPAAAPGARAAAPAAPASGDPFLRFREAKEFMNVTVVDALGIKSFFFTLKLERAGTLDDLRALAEPYREAIAKGEGENHADVLAARLEELLA